MAHILIVDDDPDFQYSLKRAVQREGHTATGCGDLKETRMKMVSMEIDAVFLDVKLPDGNGLDLLPELNRHPSHPETVIITGAGDVQGAELAITNGAWDYINKDTSPKDITLILKRALEYREEKLLAAEKNAPLALRRESIIGGSRAIMNCFDQVAKCAASEVNVVITGETGTGKELFARAIHQNSSRNKGPFVVVDCAALPETLTESILFGHQKGAFTGADSSRKGLVAEAQGGTLFLDEIGELPLNTQKTFLRVLQERTIRPVGSREEVRCDFRLVSATNRNLEEMVEASNFRSDLFFRIQSASIHLPPLRSRAEDIIPIATFHINRLCDQLGTERKGVSGAFFDSLWEYGWPGNVRELVNCLEQTIVIAGREPTLFPKHLPLKIRIMAKQAAFTSKSDGDESPSPIDKEVSAEDLQPLQEFREAVYGQAEKRYLQELMKICSGRVQDALQISGLSQSRLYALLKKHELSFGRKNNR